MGHAKRKETYLEELLGARMGSEVEVVASIEKGFPVRAITNLLQAGFSRAEIGKVIIPERTLKHRRSRKEPLSKEESDKALRTARILAEARTLFGSTEAALQWMRTAKRRFAGRTPVEMIATEAGARLVEEMLVQTEEGMFA